MVRPPPRATRTASLVPYTTLFRSVGTVPSRLVHVAHLPARDARYGELARPLHPRVAERVPERLWSHQTSAIDLARTGRSVVVASGTASGKSLCYQVPIAEASVAPIRPGTALVLFPTKALAPDQQIGRASCGESVWRNG